MASHSVEGHVPKEVRQALADAGFVYERRNRHIVYRHTVTRQIITIPYTTGDLNIARIVKANIRRAQAAAGKR